MANNRGGNKQPALTIETAGTPQKNASGGWEGKFIAILSNTQQNRPTSVQFYVAGSLFGAPVPVDGEGRAIADLSGTGNEIFVEAIVPNTRIRNTYRMNFPAPTAPKKATPKRVTFRGIPMPTDKKWQVPLQVVDEEGSAIKAKFQIELLSEEGHLGIVDTDDNGSVTVEIPFTTGNRRDVSARIIGANVTNMPLFK